MCDERARCSRHDSSVAAREHSDHCCFAMQVWNVRSCKLSSKFRRVFARVPAGNNFWVGAYSMFLMDYPF
jgi:hypothetical protein